MLESWESWYLQVQKSIYFKKVWNPKFFKNGRIPEYIFGKRTTCGLDTCQIWRNISIFGFFIVTYAPKKYDVVFKMKLWDFDIGIRRQNKCRIWKPEEILSPKHLLFIPTCSYESLTLIDLHLAWAPSNVKLDNVIWSNDHHYQYLCAKWPI